MPVWVLVLGAVAGEPEGEALPMWVLIVTSAAVATLVSSGIGALSQWLERKGRMREMLFRAAMEREKDAREALDELLAVNPGSIAMPPVWHLAENFRMLCFLFKRGNLSPEAISAMAKTLVKRHGDHPLADHVYCEAAGNLIKQGAKGSQFPGYAEARARLDARISPDNGKEDC